MGELKKITPEQVALFLSKRDKKRIGGRKATTTSPPADIADDVLNDFSASRLLKALKDKDGKRIDLEWIIHRKLDLLDDPDAKVAERKALLDDLQGYLILIAVQNPSLAAEVQRRTGIKPGGRSSREDKPDPFDPNKKLKLAGAG